MASVFFEAFDEVNSELGHISAFIAGVCCLREYQSDMQVEIELLSIVEKKVEIAKLIVKTMLLEHRKLKEDTKESAASTQPEQAA